MELEHLKINILGDSISYGMNASCEENSYVGHLRKKYPDAIIRNYSVSGSCLSDKCLWGAESFNARVEEMDPDADLVLIFGGTNDYCCCAPLGKQEDWTLGTFYGACNLLFEKLLRTYHGKTVVIATPLHRLDEDGTICEERSMLAPLWDYVDILKKAAAYFAFPVIDLFTTSGLQPNFDFIRDIYVPDGLHPNDAGHKLLFEKIDSALRHL